MTYSQNHAELQAQLDAAQARIAELERRLQAGAADQSLESALLKAVPDLVFRMDGQGVIWDYKADERDLYVQSRDAILGRSARDILPPAVAGMLKEAITAALETGAPQILTYQLDLPHQGLRDYEARIVQSGPDEILAMVRDVSDHKLIERGLQASEQRYRLLFEAAGDGIVVVDRERRILDANTRFCALVGRPQAEVVGTAVAELMSRMPTGMSAQVKASLAEKGSATVESEVYRRDGSLLPVEVSLTPLPDGHTLSMVRSIAERKRAETALRQSEEKFARLFQGSPIAAILSHLDNGRYAAVNDAFTALTGYSAEEVIGRTSLELGILSPEERAAQLTALQSGPLRNREATITVKGGTLKTCLLSLDLIAVAEEAHLLVSVLDITERKQAEQELLALNRTLEKRVAARAAEVQDLYDNAPLAYVTLDADGCITGVNQTGVVWLGYGREEILGRSASDFLVAFSKASLAAHLSMLLKDGERNDLEYVVQHKDGSTRDVLVHAKSRYAADGSLQSIRVALFDISERRRTQAQGELQARLLAAIGQAVIVTDAAGYITYWNQAARKLYGWRQDEVLGRPIGEVTVPHLAQEQAAEIMTALAAGQEWSGEFTVQRRDGSIFWAMVHNTPVCDEDGQIRYIIGISSDISERKQVEETARRAALETERTLRLRDGFLANMSHELRTPLNSILTLSEVLAAGVYGPINQRQQAAIETVETSGRHLLALINDVLDLSKIEADQLTLNLDAVNLDEVCRASMAFTRELAHKKQISVAYHVAQPAPQIQGDARRLKQMVVNLLSNAVKFTPEGGAVELEVAVDDSLSQVQIVVRDNGIGIAATDLPKLFKPFSQIDSSLARQHEGTGLGLALVKNLAALHGGSVSVESAGVLGQGSCFTITLPYAPAPLLNMDTHN